MKRIFYVLLCSVSCLLTHATAGESITFNRDSGDLRVATLQSAPDTPLANVSRDTVSFTAALDQHQAIANSQSFEAISREYRKSITAAELRQGVAIRATGPGVVVAVSPLGAVRGAGLNPRDLSIATADGTVLRGIDAMDQFADRSDIQATGVPFSNGMVGFRLNRSLGDGQFVLKALKGNLAERYQLHVLDANGSAELSLRAPEQTLVGQSFEARGQFMGATATELTSATAFIVDPAGQRTSARVVLDGSAYSVQASATRATSFGEGLWELHVSAMSADGIPRNVKTAFTVAHPTARFDGTLQRSGMSFSVGVEAASAGRYEVSAILYGTSKAGLVPVATSATAQWLERGASVIDLSFDSDTVARAGVQAPFELRSIALKDQSRMSVLEYVIATTEFE